MCISVCLVSWCNDTDVEADKDDGEENPSAVYLVQRSKNRKQNPKHETNLEEKLDYEQTWCMETWNGIRTSIHDN